MTNSPTLPLLGSGPAVLAFDVGGTDTKSALIDASGAVVGLRRTATPAAGANTAVDVVESIAGLASTLVIANPGAELSTAGISVPGLVDEARGIGLFSANLGWRNAPIRDLAEPALGLAVSFGHDVRAAGIAEHRLGAARGFRDVVVIVIGTGIAGTIILNGQPYVGTGFAGEIGHSLVNIDGERCSCGAIGCLETTSSASAIARHYSLATGTVASGARTVMDAARGGDEVAARIWNDAIDALADSLARLTAVLAPEAIVIGGGLSRAGADLFTPLQSKLESRLSFHQRPQLLEAQLGDDAGLLGTAIRAREMQGHPGFSEPSA